MKRTGEEPKEDEKEAVVTLVETKKRKKSMKMRDIVSADEEDEPDDIPEGFHLHEEPALH